MEHNHGTPQKTPIRRCAIYTRKSCEEGLEQTFNSSHAQREACEAFIKSQADEGWRLVKTAYDDGGLSGGTKERRALQRLLADVNQGMIDVVVVYKVDRLTRSLTDFAKMVEVFDARGVAFVALTQQFNTDEFIVHGANHRNEPLERRDRDVARTLLLSHSDLRDLCGTCAVLASRPGKKRPLAMAGL